MHVHDKPFAMHLDAAASSADASVAGGGIEIYLDSIGGGLARRGIRLVELRFGDASDAADQPARYRMTSSSVIPDLAQLKRVEHIVAAEEPDLIHLHSTYYAVHPLFLARLAKICPIVLTQHDVTPICFKHDKLHRDGTICERKIGAGCMLSGCYRLGTRTGVFRDLARMMASAPKLSAMRRLAHVIVPSHYLRDELLRNGFHTCRIRVLAQFSRFQVMPPRQSVPRNTRRLLYVGRLVEEKGPLVLFDALARLQTTDWELVVVGTGPLLPLLHERSRSLTGTVHFHGALPPGALQDAYLAADVVVFPSLIPESFGLVGVEAMSLGRPVVAFPSGGVTEWLEHDTTGFFAEHGNASDLARQIDRVLNDPGLRQRFSTAARDRAEALFSLDRHLDGLVATYRDAIASFAVH